jgi:hypothetical protein
MLHDDSLTERNLAVSRHRAFSVVLDGEDRVA